MIAALEHVRFPDAVDFDTAHLQIRILGAVEPLPSGLSRIERAEDSRVTMPVVAIELNDERRVRYESVNAELASNKVLTKVAHAEGIEHCISCLFQLRRAHRLLVQIHGYETSTGGGVFVPTGNRAVLDVVVALARRRPSESLSADSTRVRGLETTTPGVTARLTTECGYCDARTRCVECSSAELARLRFAGAVMNTSAGYGAARLISTATAGFEFRPTNGTRLCGNARGYTLACPRAEALLHPRCRCIEGRTAYCAFLSTTRSPYRTRRSRRVEAGSGAVVSRLYFLWTYAALLTATRAVYDRHAVIVVRSRSWCNRGRNAKAT